MQPLTSAMTRLGQALLATLSSFLRGRSFLQALFSFWVNPTTLQEQKGKTALPRRTVEGFLKEARRRLLGPIEGDQLRCFSKKLKLQFKERLQHHAASMLPSFNHLLPSGTERGNYLALDVGGSTLRVALVALRGREAVGNESEIVRMQIFKITPEIKGLEGMDFFEWMAIRIREVIKDDVAETSDRDSLIPLGLAWSFPVEYESHLMFSRYRGPANMDTDKHR